MSSLFPAYAATPGDADVNSIQSDTKKEDWLKNVSFIQSDAEKLQQLHGSDDRNKQNETTGKIPAEIAEVQLKRIHYVHDKSSTSSETDEVKDHQHHHHHKKHKHSKKRKVKYLESGTEEEDYRDRRHHVKKKKKSKKHKKHNKDDKIKTEGEKNGSLLLKQQGKIFVEDFGQMTVDCPFYFDKSPDTSNFTYQSIYKMHIASYWPTYNVSLGGAGLFRKPDKRTKKSSFNRYYSLKDRSDSKDGDIAFIEPEQIICDHKESVKVKPVLEEFMLLSDGQTRNNVGENDTKQSEMQVMHESRNKNTALQKQEEFNRKLRENPNNVSLWLDFIIFQDEFCPEARDLGQYRTSQGMEKSKKLEAVIIRTKEAIFERALKENPFSAPLKLAQLEYMHEYWDSDVVNKEWKELSARNLNNMDIWRKYLDYMESKSTSFTISGLLKIYKKCFVAMKRSLEHGINAIEFLTEIFVRLCYRLSQAGLSEKAVALFQALLEYNLYAPGDDLVTDRSDLMEYFTAFWESSAPRIGENFAHGWCYWMKHQGNVQSSFPLVLKDDEDTMEEEILQKSSQKSMLWCMMETLRSSRHWLPWRPDEKGSYDDCEDPERLVISDDLTFALFNVDTLLQKLKLVCSFLEYMGVPNITSYSSSSPICATEALTPIKSQTISQIFCGPGYEAYTAKCHEDRDLSLVNRETLIQNIFSQIMPLFKSSEATSMKLFMMYVDFLEWRLAFGNQAWSAAELKPQVKEARTCMRKLLAEEPYRTSIWAWLRYGQMEWKLGRVEDARKALYHTVTGLARTGSNHTYPHCIGYKLYRNYAELEMGFVQSKCLFVPQECTANSRHLVQKLEKALQILVSLCEGGLAAPSDTFTITTAQLLKCKRHYHVNLRNILDKMKDAEFPNDEDMFVMNNMGSSLEHWLMCAELFSYITSGLQAAVELYEDVQKSLDTVLSQLMEKQNHRRKMVTTVRQAVTEAHLSLLKFHLRRTYAPLRTFQTPLLTALKEQPNNASILWSYIQMELKSSFTGNMRRYLARECKTTKSALVWTLSIVAQLKRFEQLQKANIDALGVVHTVPEAHVVLAETGFVHTVKTWFQWAVSSPVCRHYLLIWRLYLKFEIQYGNTETTKRVFYDAIQHCPWAKCLYLDYVQASPASTQELVDLMIEREIRVHVPMEELDILLEGIQS